MSDSSGRGGKPTTAAVLLTALAVSLCMPVLAQDTVWKTYNEKGTTLYQDGEYVKAEKMLLEAIAEAEKFGPADKRLLTSLRALADCYRAEGKKAEAELLDRGIVEIGEKKKGEHRAAQPKEAPSESASPPAAAEAAAAGTADGSQPGSDEPMDVKRPSELRSGTPTAPSTASTPFGQGP